MSQQARTFKPLTVVSCVGVSTGIVASAVIPHAKELEKFSG